jgi:hypothetical protein
LSEEIVTDRPDATESSSVVLPGYFQTEMGWKYSEDGEIQTHAIPQTLVRIGVVERVELRLGWDGYVDQNSAGSGSGAGDGEVGTKIYLGEERGALPEAALLGSVSIPWGDSEISTDEVDPAFRFAFSHTLTDKLGLGYNLGAEWETENNSTLGSFVYTIALGIGLTEEIGMFVEFFGDVGLSASGSSHTFDGGFTYLLRENVQLDILGGVGLSGNAEDWFAGAGISFRLPD